jgi:2-methylisocitrate lyase-like PEP mutase family enzyme
VAVRHTTSLKALLATRRAAILPGAANALTARIIADLGFDSIYVTGAGIANMYLGVPDIGLVSLKEVVDHVAAMRDVVDLPLLVDADTGFGNAVNVVRTVKQLEKAGASGVQLEDQVFPKRCGHFLGKEVIETDEMVQKVKAAVDSRTDGDFVIVARTDARAMLGLDAAIERARRYVEAGADATFVEAPLGADELERIGRDLPVPQIANMVVGGRTPLVEHQDLAAMGFGGVLYANAALQAAVHGMQEVLGELRRSGSLAAVGDKLASFEERQRLVDKDAYDALEQRYAGSTLRKGASEA